MMIRGDTIKYSSIKKKLSCKEEKDLEKEIKDLEDNINTNFSHIINEQLNTLAQKKDSLEEIQKAKIQGVMLRS